MISIRQLTKHYGSNPVLRGIDLDVGQGEFVVILGQSGAGKSTLLRCINRLVQADSGTLQVAGIDARSCRDPRTLRRQVAMIFQHHNELTRSDFKVDAAQHRVAAVVFGQLADADHFMLRKSRSSTLAVSRTTS